ncbi:MAG: alpha/beta hydrolase [Alphaproteobacteria bacterium]|nr:alpha/beta hydrolase [Alphaproteobacteria bacterium]
MASVAIKKAYADTSQGQVHYRYVHGPGTPVVFLHRAPASSVSFVNMMMLMAGERGLYAFDIPGFGMSFAPTGQPTAPDYGRWILEAIDHVGLGTFHMFLHHTGTHFGTEIAAAHPSRVKSLALNGIAYLTAEERAQHAAAVKEMPPPDAEGKYMASQFSRIAGLLPAFDPMLYHEEMIGSFLSTYARHKSFNAVWGQDYPAVLKRVTCPILATTAENEFWRFCFDRVFVDHPTAQRAVLGPAKFYTPELDAAATVAALRTFIDRVERT